MNGDHSHEPQKKTGQCCTGKKHTRGRETRERWHARVAQTNHKHWLRPRPSLATILLETFLQGFENILRRMSGLESHTLVYRALLLLLS